MSEPSKLHGTKDKVAGAIKETTGHIVGNAELEARGESQKETGKAEIESVKQGQRNKGYGEQVLGEAQQTTGVAIGNKQMEKDGNALKKEGESRVKANQ